ncbi:MAG TPA: hypothetical protein VES97_12385, partial [Solirubrobacteraceae bacterium]|nr:hypothetical protein [Solirubrobacteraceae bacterium]
MRPIRLGPALAAAATLLALAPAGASAARGHRNAQPRNHAGLIGCRISAFAEPHVVTSGESVQVFGALNCIGGASTASQTITVYEHSVGTPGIKVLGTATTGPGGFYSIIAPALTADSAFQARFLGARSANRVVKVAPQVTLGGPADGSQLLTGARTLSGVIRRGVTFTGTVTPADAGALVTLQRENATSNEEWRAIQRGVVGPGGTFSLTHVFVAPGDANIRVVVRKHMRFTIRGVSNTLSYEISQAENPKLTINTSADPISYGQPVTISGVLAGGAGQKVTLLAHARGAAFAKVGEATANGSG